MKTDSRIVNMQGADAAPSVVEYLAAWETRAKVWLTRCPVCPAERVVTDEGAVIPWFVIVRRTMRSLTVRCKDCELQFTVTYRCLRRSLDGCADLLIRRGVPGVERDASLERLDIFERRGRTPRAAPADGRLPAADGVRVVAWRKRGVAT